MLRTGTPAGEADLACIMIHGRGRSAEEMVRLADEIGADGVHVVCPAAPGGAWYPQRFLAPLSDNEPALSQSLARLEAVLDGLAAEGFGSDRILICGFSQGACLAAQMLLRRPCRYGGAIILTGGLIGPDGTDWPPRGNLGGMPVLLTGSEIDEWVPPWRVAETEQVLSTMGADVWTVIYPDRPHIVCADEIAKARSLIAEARTATTGRRRALNRA